MSRQFLGGPTLALLIAAAFGCGSDPVMQIAHDGDLAGAIAAAGTGKNPSDVARAQMPDGQAPTKTPPKLIDQPPDRPADVANAPPVARICATVNGEAILEQEVRATAYQSLLGVSGLPEPQRTEETNKIISAALAQIVEREVTIQDMNSRLQKVPKMLDKLKEAAEKEFDHQVLQPMRLKGPFKTDQDIKDYFRAQGMSLDMIRRQWHRNFMALEYLKNVVGGAIEKGTTHTIIVEYYESHPEEFKVDDNVVWQDIFIDASRHPSRTVARAHAQALADRARKGEDFAALSKQYDNGDSSLRKNAEGIGRRPNEIRPPEARDVLFKLHDGEVGSLIELSTGYHIVRVVKHELAGQMKLDEKLLKQIRDKLRNEIAQREMKRYVNELMRPEKAIIEYASGK